MKKLLPVLLAIAFTYAYTWWNAAPIDTSPAPATASVEWTGPAAFSSADAGRIVEGRGIVQRVLSDDNDGSRHQRFILQLSSGQTVLVAHNIDLAPRVERLAAGDTVAFRGEYETNAQGGVIHWTHHDPQGRHPGGWLRHRERRYE